MSQSQIISCRIQTLKNGQVACFVSYGTASNHAQYAVVDRNWSVKTDAGFVACNPPADPAFWGLFAAAKRKAHAAFDQAQKIERARYLTDNGLHVCKGGQIASSRRQARYMTANAAFFDKD